LINDIKSERTAQNAECRRERCGVERSVTPDLANSIRELDETNARVVGEFEVAFLEGTCRAMNIFAERPSRPSKSETHSHRRWAGLRLRTLGPLTRINRRGGAMRCRIDWEELSEFLTRQVRVVERLPVEAADAAADGCGDGLDDAEREAVWLAAGIATFIGGTRPKPLSAPFGLDIGICRSGRENRRDLEAACARSPSSVKGETDGIRTVEGKSAACPSP
jgi:hypothetical protein